MSAVLRRPSLAHIEGWADALNRGWRPAPNEPALVTEQLAAIADDPVAFVQSRWDPEAEGPPVVLPDGSQVERLPSVTFVLWDGAFSGIASLRWRPGTTELTPSCLGHIGYSVVPWRQGQGLATRAVTELRPWIKAVGLPHADAAVRPSNLASTRVMEKVGARLLDETQTVPAFGTESFALWRLAP